MKFNKSQKDNIIKMSNQEAKELHYMIDELVSADLDVQLNQTFWKFMDGIENLSEID